MKRRICRTCRKGEIQDLPISTVTEPYDITGEMGIQCSCAGVIRRECSYCSVKTVSVPAFDSLVNVVAGSLLFLERRLSGRELSFLRRSISINISEIAERSADYPEDRIKQEEHSDCPVLAPLDTLVRRIWIDRMGDRINISPEQKEEILREKPIAETSPRLFAYDVTTEEWLRVDPALRLS